MPMHFQIQIVKDRRSPGWVCDACATTSKVIDALSLTKPNYLSRGADRNRTRVTGVQNRCLAARRQRLTQLEMRPEAAGFLPYCLQSHHLEPEWIQRDSNPHLSG